MKKENEIIKLKPLCEKAFSSQLYNLTGKFWNDTDFDAPSGALHGAIVTEIETGQKFILATHTEELKKKQEIKEAEQKAENEAAHSFDNHPNPIIDFHNRERWEIGMNILRKENQIVEMCEDSYWHFLECVPPMFQNGNGFVNGDPYTHNAKGEAVYLCAIEIDDKFYACNGTIKQFMSGDLFADLPK